jgi:hypothetical protein
MGHHVQERSQESLSSPIANLSASVPIEIAGIERPMAGRR